MNRAQSAAMGAGAPAPPGTTPRIASLLIKPVSALCNLGCRYCFYSERETDPYRSSAPRQMSSETLERLVDGYLFYSYPCSLFAFQGGEPMLAGPAFFERLIEYQQRYRRSGQAVSNIMQTNGILIDDRWCRIFQEFHWLVGISLDGPETMHDRYRTDRLGQGSWKKVMRAIEALTKNRVEFNVICVLSQANVGEPQEVYRFFRRLGVEHMQFIPLADHDGSSRPLPSTITPQQYGRFLCDIFDLWWPERRRVRIRFFDNIAEALAGQKPSNCVMQETCDSYAVVEYNGDVYPCDFFVESNWILGNIAQNSWPEIARSRTRYSFAARKAFIPAACEVCEYQALCRGGCPNHRQDPHVRSAGMDYFCPAYKAIFAKAVGPLKKELRGYIEGWQTC